MDDIAFPSDSRSQRVVPARTPLGSKDLSEAPKDRLAAQKALREAQEDRPAAQKDRPAAQKDLREAQKDLLEATPKVQGLVSTGASLEGPSESAAPQNTASANDRREVDGEPRAVSSSNTWTHPFGLWMNDQLSPEERLGEFERWIAAQETCRDQWRQAGRPACNECGVVHPPFCRGDRKVYNAAFREGRRLRTELREAPDEASGTAQAKEMVDPPAPSAQKEKAKAKAKPKPKKQFCKNCAKHHKGGVKECTTPYCRRQCGCCHPPEEICASAVKRFEDAGLRERKIWRRSEGYGRRETGAVSGIPTMNSTTALTSGAANTSAIQSFAESFGYGLGLAMVAGGQNSTGRFPLPFPSILVGAARGMLDGGGGGLRPAESSAEPKGSKKKTKKQAAPTGSCAPESGPKGGKKGPPGGKDGRGAGSVYSQKG